MKLDQNSFSAKLYRWFFMTAEMPSNLCPYFWKLVLAFVLAIPVLLATLFYQILYFRKSFPEPADSPLERFFIGLFLWGMLFLAFCSLSPLVLIWFTPEEKSLLWNVIGSGFAVWASGAVIGIWVLIKHLKEKKDDRKYRKNSYDKNGNWIPYEDRIKEKRSNILVEFFKAKYNKYCPKIDWN